MGAYLGSKLLDRAYAEISAYRHTARRRARTYPRVGPKGLIGAD